MNDGQKVIVLMFALLCNFTFLVTAQNHPHTPSPEAMKLPECTRSHGADSMKTRVNMAYFQEHWKKKNYEGAYFCWTYVFNHAPCAYKSIYQLGPQLLSGMMEKTGTSRKSGLMDTLFMIFPARIKYYGEEAFVKGSWAYYLSKYKPGELSEIRTLYAFYFDHQKDRMDERYVKSYMYATYTALKQSLVKKDEACAIYRRLRDTASAYYQKTLDKPEDNKAWEQTVNYLDSLAPELQCAFQQTMHESRFDAIFRHPFGKIFVFNHSGIS